MALSLASIQSAKRTKPPRIVLLGVEKIGKSTFASQAPNAIFIPIRGEQGIDSLDAQSFPVAQKFEDVMESLGVLYAEDHDYKTVVIDSASALEPLIWDATCRENNAKSIEQVNGGFGKGYIEALKQWREMLDGLDALREDKDIGCIVVGHVKAKLFNDPVADPYDTYILDLQDRATNLLYRWADCILFANRKTVIREVADAKDSKKTIARHGKGTNDPILHTQKRPAHPGGGRGVYGQLPYELPFVWESFQEAVNAASV